MRAAFALGKVGTLRNRGSIMQRFLSLVLVLSFLAPTLMLTGCGMDSTHESAHEMQLAPASMLPDFARAAPDRVQEAYRFAIANPAPLKNVPCYCGCGGLGHTSNYDCYIKDTHSGKITFDDHAAYCQICVDITQDVIRMTRAGRAPPQIRDAIVTTYSQRGPSNQ